METVYQMQMETVYEMETVCSQRCYGMKTIHEIWFHARNSEEMFSVEVSSEMACQVWDMLAKEFRMLSRRPFNK